MKSYHVVTETDLQALASGSAGYFGEWHYIDLGSHGDAGAGHHAVVLQERFAPPETWLSLPHILESTKAVGRHAPHAHAKLAHVGVLHDHNTFQAAQQLAAIMREFEP